MKKEKTKLPDGIPEENVYDNTHIMIYVFYAIAVGSVILLLVNQQLNNLSIYQEKILTLANQNKSTAHIEDFNCSYDMKNPMCGDEVKVRIKILQNKIETISAIVRGCALCEASAGLVVQTFSKKNLPDIEFLENFKYWLCDLDQELPTNLPEGIKVFQPIREITNRHTCITMPFEATIKSINQFNKEI